MEALLPHIWDWFSTKRQHFEAFSKADTRAEGWFKAELLVLFNELIKCGCVAKCEREVNLTSPQNGKRKQVDFRLHLQGESHLCELKALCISQKAGTPRNLNFYFRDDHVGLVRDFKKLDELPDQNKWVLGFVYPAPKIQDWRNAIATLPAMTDHWRCVTSPEDFPEFVFIALWRG